MSYAQGRVTIRFGDYRNMGKVVGFPIGDRHVGVERVARQIYQETKDEKRQLAMAMQRANKIYQRALIAGVPNAVAYAQAQHLAGMIGAWIDELEGEEIVRFARGKPTGGDAGEVEGEGSKAEARMTERACKGEM